MADPNSPFWAKDIMNPQSWEKPFEENPAEVYNAYKRGDYGPSSKNDAYDLTRLYFNSPALQATPGKFQMPNVTWPADKYEDYMSKTPMSDLNTISKLLKAG